MRFLITFFLITVLAVPVQALQLRQHEIQISPASTVEIPVSNLQDNPIVVRITPPEGLQVFPRRARLLPGERQVIKVRQVGELPYNSWMAFSYAVQSEEKQGVHSRITLRLPVREVSR